MLIRKLRYLALVTDAFGGHGGISQYNCDLLEALAKLPTTAAVRVLPRVVVGDIGELPQRLIQMPAPHGVASYILAAVWTALWSPVDVVFCGHIHIAPLAAFIAWFKRAKFIVQVHGIEVWDGIPRITRWALERADLVLCVSRHTRASILKVATLNPEIVMVLPNTVGDIFLPGDGATLRHVLGLDGKRVLLTVGRIDARERYKGHDRVIAAIPALVSKGHDVHYLIVGSGDDVPRLQTMAGDYGIVERVFFAGDIDKKGLVDAYRMADLFVMPSTGEGFGIVFLEAMACGTLALGLTVGGAVDALEGLGVAIDEKAILASAIDELLIAPAPDREVLAAAIRARFGREAFAMRVNKLVDFLGYYT